MRIVKKNYYYYYVNILNFLNVNAKSCIGSTFSHIYLVAQIMTFVYAGAHVIGGKLFRVTGWYWAKWAADSVLDYMALGPPNFFIIRKHVRNNPST